MIILFQRGPRGKGCEKVVVALQVWRSFTEHLDLAIAERKLHKVFRLLTSAEDALEDVAQRCNAGDAGALLPLHLWLEQKEATLEQSRRSAITLLERSIMVRRCLLSDVAPVLITAACG